MVQFANGAYAIRKLKSYGRDYEYMDLDDGYWWSLGTGIGRQWYESMDKLKVQQAFDKMVKDGIQEKKREEELKARANDKGTVVSGGSSPIIAASRRAGMSELRPDPPKGRTITDKLKLPKFLKGKWFTD